MNEGSAQPNRADGELVKTVGVHKRYGGIHALKGVTVSFGRAEIHALVGENGAGKSTLGKIVAGDAAASSGELLVDGVSVRFSRPKEALDRGIAIVHQELALLPSRSVIDNVFLGLESRSKSLFAAGDQRRRYQALIKRWGFGLDPEARVGSLSIADQQKVEILRALAREARLIVMDEPTARLSRPEAEQLHRIVRSLKKQGKTIVLVSHFLGEVLELADRITIMRDGEIVRTSVAGDESPDSLIKAMLGRSLESSFPARPRLTHGSEPVLEVSDLSGPGFRDVSFVVRPGEILGIVGMVGSGRSQVLRTIFGQDAAHGGEVTLAGAPLKARSPRESISQGLAMLPESRKDEGLLLKRSVSENIVLPHLALVARKGGVIDRSAERRQVKAVIEELGIRCAGPNAGVKTLSGGNQQKVVLGKWLVDRPLVMLLDEPTRGVDVGAKRTIYELIFALAAAGTGVVVVSSELEEVLGLADSILVMRRGRLVRTFGSDEVDEEILLTAAFGTAEEVSRA